MDCSVFRCCGIKTGRKDWDLVYSHWHLHAKGGLLQTGVAYGAVHRSLFWFFFIMVFFGFFFLGWGIGEAIDCLG